MQGWHISHRAPAPLGARRALPVAGALAVVAVLALAATGTARASDKVYTVANYPVEAVARNAVAAKKKALADGRQAAFRTLLRRLVPVTAYARSKRLGSVRAADLVEAVRVRSERNSRTRYLATYDFTFQAKSIRDMLRREGVPFTDVQAPVVTLIPVWQGGSAKDQAAWAASWKGLDLTYSLTPIKLATLRKDLPQRLVVGVARGDQGAVRALALKYQTERLLVAIAGRDAVTGRLAFTLAGIDAVGPFALARRYRIDPADPAYTRELAAVVALRIIEGRWKEVHAHGAGTAPGGPRGETDLLISVRFRGMGEWQDISRRLGDTPGVEELEVAGLSARGARVTLRYAAGAERLVQELARRGLSLRNDGGTWALSQR